jgi:uncharacterized membrane protein
MMLPGSTTGVLLAILVGMASFTPSLLPRDWVTQGVVSGLTVAVAYPLGLLVGRTARWFGGVIGLEVHVSDRARPWLRWVSIAVFALVLTLVWWWSHQGHQDTARLVGLPAPSARDDIRATLLAVLIAAALWHVVVGLRLARRGFVKASALVLPSWLAGVAGTLALVLLLAWVSNDVVFRRSLESVSRTAAELNATSPEGLEAPRSWSRSGSPGAIQEWSDLGYYGQRFVSSGPDAARIREVTEVDDAITPIRVYAGREADHDVADVVETVLREMRRTGAFDRDVLVLMATTGRGWIDEFNAQAVEYLTAGDCALVGMQYSYLPSPFAFVADRRTPVEANVALLEAVEAELSRIPEPERPRLMLTGESLGAYGAQAAFADDRDLLERVDGAVWVGTPSFTPLWWSLTERRHRGSPQVAPVVDDGRNIRFVTSPRELTHDLYGRRLGMWEHPRVVYMQHASDPIVWWSPRVALFRPTWLEERAGRDVTDRFRWVPLVSFFALGLDMVTSNDPAAGHGHRYEDDMVPTWAAVLGVDEAPLERIVDAIAEVAPDDG